MSLTEDIKTLIPLEVAEEENIFRGELPDSPDNLVAIFQTGGANSSHSFDARQFEEPIFQIMIRDTSYDTAFIKAETLKDALDGQTELVIGGNTYLSIFLQGDVLSLGKDDNDRTKLSINFKTKVKRA